MDNNRQKRKYTKKTYNPEDVVHMLIKTMLHAPTQFQEQYDGLDIKTKLRFIEKVLPELIKFYELTMSQEDTPAATTESIQQWMQSFRQDASKTSLSN